MRIVVQHAVGDPAWHPSVLAPPFVAEFARLAERHGYAGIAFTDHPAPTVRWTAAGGEGSADPLVSLAYCAAVTSSIELMTFVLALPYHNPFRLAHQAATLDALSGGRLTLGLGTGYLRGEMRAMGADPAARLDRSTRCLRRCCTAWSSESISGSFPALGAGWSAREVHVQPRPVQQPHPPLWFHGNSAFGRARAARYGGGWLGILTTPQLAATMRTAHLPDLAAARRWSLTCAAGARRPGGTQASVEVGLAACGRCSTSAEGGTRTRSRRPPRRRPRSVSGRCSRRSAATTPVPPARPWRVRRAGSGGRARH
jgi:probable F420-dependent oxidoreductase